MPPPLKSAASLGISYRPMAAADLPFLAALYASTRADEMAATGWPEEARQQFLAQQFDAQHRHYMAHYEPAEWLIVERDGVAIGRLYIRQSEGASHIIDISLLPAARGLGIGGAILADILDAAAQAGKRVELHVEKSNPARRLYARMGFAVIEDRGAYDLLSAGGRPN